MQPLKRFAFKCQTDDRRDICQIEINQDLRRLSLTALILSFEVERL